MYGLFIGALIGLVLNQTEVLDEWWILWSALIGLVTEVSARLGCPDLIVVIADALSSIDFNCD